MYNFLYIQYTINSIVKQSTIQPNIFAFFVHIHQWEVGDFLLYICILRIFIGNVQKDFDKKGKHKTKYLKKVVDTDKEF